MSNKKVCTYCGKEIKENQRYCSTCRYDEPYYEGESIWHLDCYEKDCEETLSEH